jgi:hypothetical protein
VAVTFPLWSHPTAQQIIVAVMRLCCSTCALLLLSCNVDDRWTMTCGMARHHLVWILPCMQYWHQAKVDNNQSDILLSGQQDHTVALYNLHVVAIHLHQFKARPTVEEQSINPGSLFFDKKPGVPFSIISRGSRSKRVDMDMCCSAVPLSAYDLRA